MHITKKDWRIITHTVATRQLRHGGDTILWDTAHAATLAGDSDVASLATAAATALHHRQWKLAGALLDQLQLATSRQPDEPTRRRKAANRSAVTRPPITSRAPRFMHSGAKARHVKTYHTGLTTDPDFSLAAYYYFTHDNRRPSGAR